ncbi:fluoride efflux transporter CrcB [Nonomuraea cavernae]|uniref:fluoride efflux transporter CrcB n=1 Tax=Nonomuraea cavernae TaxID=2045107 RepID=UPI0033DAC4C2
MNSGEHLGRRERAEAVALHPHGAPAWQPGVFLDIAIGGAVGALARYLLTAAIPASPTGFPWGTFTVNVIGCFLMGLLTSYLLASRPRPFVRPFAVTGYLGGFTTFSHLIDGIHNLGDAGRWGLGVGYAVASVVIGWIAVVAGLMLGKHLPHHKDRTT